MNAAPSDAEQLRATLDELGFSQSSFARWMAEHGDHRNLAVILRSVQRIANGDARLSGEMRVILTLLRQREAS